MQSMQDLGLEWIPNASIVCLGILSAGVRCVSLDGEQRRVQRTVAEYWVEFLVKCHEVCRTLVNM